MDLQETDYCIWVQSQIAQIKSEGKLKSFIDYINASNNACQLRNGDLFNEPESEPGFEFLKGELERRKEEKQKQRLANTQKALGDLTEEIKKLERDAKKGGARDINKRKTELNNKLKKLLLENHSIHDEINQDIHSITKDIIPDYTQQISEMIRKFIPGDIQIIEELKEYGIDHHSIDEYTVLLNNWKNIENDVRIKQINIENKKLEQELIQIEKDNKSDIKSMKSTIKKLQKLLTEFNLAQESVRALENFAKDETKVHITNIYKLHNKLIDDHVQAIEEDKKQELLDETTNEIIPLVKKTNDLAHETADLITDILQVGATHGITFTASFDDWEKGVDRVIKFTESVPSFSTLDEADKFKIELQKEYNYIENTNKKARGLNQKVQVEADKKKKADAAAIQKISKKYRTDEKIAELLFYTCIIHNIMTNPKLKGEINKVFENHIERQNRTDFYTKNNVLSEFKNTLLSFKTKNELASIETEYKEIKNDYEIFKGPVRVYLKLRKFLQKKIIDTKGRTIITGDDPNKLLFQNITEFQIEKQNSKNICYNTVSKDKEISDDIKKMVSEKTDHTFSYIYDKSKDSPDIFKESIKETINNIIPMGENSIIMAYGPSGSGKTFNLIGDNFDHPTKTPDYGIIYQVLRYLNTGYNKQVMNDNDKIKHIELTSWQYYMYCGKVISDQVKDDHPYECKRFNSLSAFKKNVIDAIQNKNIDHKQFVSEYLTNTVDKYGNKKTNINYTYKYERDPKKVSLETSLENGVERFKENKIQLDDTTNVISLLLDGLGKDFVKKYINDKDYDIDDTVLRQQNINKADFKKWLEIMGIEENEFSKLKYRITESVFYMKGMTIKHLFKIANKDDFMLKADEFKNSKYINMEDHLVPVLAATTKTKRVIKKESRDALFVEANILLLFITRFYEYGRLTVPNYNKMFIEIRNNESRNKGLYETPIYLELGDEKVIEETFTKFYLALVRARPTRATVNNPDSSRTHLVVNVKIIKEGGGESNLRFVDLAGNEKADENYFMMRREGNGITASLLAIKNLLIAKQSEDSIAKLTDKDKRVFFTSCRTPGQLETCEELYDECKKVFETDAQKEYKLLDLDNENTTVSMYLNLPTYLKLGNDTNQCLAIADSLYFIKKLQEATKISETINKLSLGICQQLYNNWETEKTKFGRKRQPKKRKHYKGYTFVKFKKSTKSGKKYDAVFKNVKTGRTKTISFGSKGMSDYTKHKDDDRKYQYLKRHRKRENWNNLMTAGALSRWVLWNKKSLKASMADYKKRFNGR